MSADDHGETRAEIARRRLNELAASFNATLSEDLSGDEASEPEATEKSGRFGSRFASLRGSHLVFVSVLMVMALVLVGWWLFSGTGNHTAVVSASQLSDPSAGQSADQSAGQDPDQSAEMANGTTGKAGANPAANHTHEILIVHVVGRVKNPGIVTVPAGARVDDAIAAAGGLHGKVDLAALNLARPLVDGEQVRIGLPPPLDPTAVGSAAPAGSQGSGTGTGAAGGKVNLNTASAAELESLPGVGPVTAESIIAWRSKNQRFRSVEDLLDVRGIGAATLERLRPLVSL